MAALAALILLLLLRLLLSGPALAPAMAATTDGTAATAQDTERPAGDVPHIAHLAGIDAALAVVAPSGPRVTPDAPGDVPPAELPEGAYLPLPAAVAAGSAGESGQPHTRAAYSPAAPRGPPPPVGP